MENVESEYGYPLELGGADILPHGDVDDQEQSAPNAVSVSQQNIGGDASISQPTDKVYIQETCNFFAILLFIQIKMCFRFFSWFQKNRKGTIRKISERKTKVRTREGVDIDFDEYRSYPNRHNVSKLFSHFCVDPPR